MTETCQIRHSRWGDSDSGGVRVDVSKRNLKNYVRGNVAVYVEGGTPYGVFLEAIRKFPEQWVPSALLEDSLGSSRQCPHNRYRVFREHCGYYYEEEVACFVPNGKAERLHSFHSEFYPFPEDAETPFPKSLSLEEVQRVLATDWSNPRSTNIVEEGFILGP